LTGYNIQDVKGRIPINVGKNSLTDKNAVIEMIKSFSAKKSFNIEIIHSRKDGSWFWSRCKGQPILNEKGEIVQYFAMIEDITREKERDNQLNILSSIAEKNTNGVIISNKKGKVEWVNKSFERITGYSLNEVVGTKPGKYLQGKDTNPDTIEYLRKQIRQGEPFVCEILNYHKSGKAYWVRLQGQALKDQGGKILKYFAIQEDITAEKEIQQKLKEFESRFRLALEKIGDNVWEYDFLTNKTVFSNPKNVFIDNLTNKQNEKKHSRWAHVHKEDLDLVMENDRRIRSGETDYHEHEYRIMLPNEGMHWVLDRGVVIEKDTEGKPLKMIGTQTDITEKKNTEEAIKRKEEKYRNIIANMNLGLLEVDIDEKIQFANQRFCEMSGYKIEELIGIVASEKFVRNESRELINSKNKKRKSLVSDVYEVSVSNKKGEHKWWMISGAPNFNDKGEVVGSIGIHLDITKQKKLELELIEAKNSAEASKRTKEIFLANMSHEIRTPMNAILGMSNQLSKTKLKNDQELYLNTIQSAANNLLIIINDILDLSKIDAGKLSIENIGFEPVKIIEEVMQVMSYKAQEKGISFTNTFNDKKLSPVLIGDPYRINQILLNLVSNGIKFTEKGEVSIICSVLEDTANSQRINITVKDTGVGMDESFIDQVFEKFTQEYKKGSKKNAGTGLGMNISKELVELMGGKINVESKQGVGTAISFSLELQKGDFSNIIETDNVELTSDFLKGKKIVVADDNDHNRLVASIILKNYGAEIFEAVNGEEALRVEEKYKADLILMDIQMPVLNGYEATKILRTRGDKIPIIAVTANAIKGEDAKCIEAGMNDYISKSFKEEDFLKILAKWVTKKSQFNDKNKKQAVVFTESSAPLYDLKTLNALSRGNKLFIQKMVKLFCDQSPMLVKEMITAYKINDIKKMGALAHKIKPTLDNLNIDSLKQDIRTIENAGKENNALPELNELLEKTEKTIVRVINKMKKEFPDL